MYKNYERIRWYHKLERIMQLFNFRMLEFLKFNEEDNFDSRVLFCTIILLHLIRLS